MADRPRLNAPRDGDGGRRAAAAQLVRGGADGADGAGGESHLSGDGRASGFALRDETQPATLSVCAESPGETTKTGSKTVTLVAPTSAANGSTLVLTIGLQDGPVYTYTNRADAAPSCPRPRLLASAVAETAQATCTARVRFVFTQGGLPRRPPRRVVDMRTAGRGQGTVRLRPDGSIDEHTLEVTAARVVRERDLLVSVLEEEETERLVFARAAPADQVIVGNQEIGYTLRTELRLADSTDPRCPVRRRGRPRRAQLILDDNLGLRPDSVQLDVRGCPHHDSTFEGRRRVKVAITVR